MNHVVEIEVVLEADGVPVGGTPYKETFHVTSATPFRTQLTDTVNLEPVGTGAVAIPRIVIASPGELAFIRPGGNIVVNQGVPTQKDGVFVLTGGRMVPSVSARTDLLAQTIRGFIAGMTV